jgi:hypothetical protein
MYFFVPGFCATIIFAPRQRWGPSGFGSLFIKIYRPYRANKTFRSYIPPDKSGATNISPSPGL